MSAGEDHDWRVNHVSPEGNSDMASNRADRQQKPASRLNHGLTNRVAGLVKHRDLSRSGHPPPLTPVGAIVRGLVAGAAGTAAMDALLFARYRHGGGTSSAEEWELSNGLSSWEEAPAPAQVGKRLVEGLFDRKLPPTQARLVNNLTHWAFGMLAGSQYGIVAGSLPRPRVLYGLPFGATVWATGYVVLPAAKLYQPIWKYDRKTLAEDLSAHLVYGVATAGALRLLAGKARGSTGVTVS
jgi:hypothetical protein